MTGLKVESPKFSSISLDKNKAKKAQLIQLLVNRGTSKLEIK